MTPFREIRDHLNPPKGFSMTNRLDPEDVRDKADMAECLRRYIPDVKIRGARAWARCPWHGGVSQNSFKANIDKKLWNCFSGCGGGDIFSLIMKMENCSFGEALKIANEEL